MFIFLLAVESFSSPLVWPGYCQSNFGPWFNDFDTRDWEASKLCPSVCHHERNKHHSKASVLFSFTLYPSTVS